jgi:type VI secretion system protein ImpI
VPEEAAPPPINPLHLHTPAEARPQQPDFLDWVVDVPEPQLGHSGFAPAPRSPPLRPPVREAVDFDDTADWLRGPPATAPAEAPQPMAAVPRPRRPGTAVPEMEVFPDRYAEELPPSAAPPPPVSEPAPPPTAADLPQPAAEPVPPQTSQADLLRRLAKGCGVPEEAFAGRDAGDVAEELGMLMRIVAENLKQLLVARAESRGLMRSSNQTMVQALDNNPLKFSPTPEDALRIMFGPRTKSYLDAPRTLQQSFDDIKAHQIDTYTAMQHALQMLLEDFDPHAIERATPAESGLGAVIGSRKAKLWDSYVARWDAKSSRREAGLVDAFMLYFSECYQRNAKRTR